MVLTSCSKLEELIETHTAVRNRNEFLATVHKVDSEFEETASEPFQLKSSGWIREDRFDGTLVLSICTNIMHVHLHCSRNGNFRSGIATIKTVKVARVWRRTEGGSAKP